MHTLLFSLFGPEQLGFVLPGGSHGWSFSRLRSWFFKCPSTSIPCGVLFLIVLMLFIPIGIR